MSDEPPTKKLYTFKQRAMGFGKRRTEARTTAPQLTTVARPTKTVAQNQIQASITRIEPAFSDPAVTCSLFAKDLYSYRQVSTTNNWEDTLFTKSFVVVFHKALESLPIPEQGYAICLIDLAARCYGDLGSYDKFLGGEIRHKDFDDPICLPYLPIVQFNDKAILDQLKFLKNQDRFPKAVRSNEFEVDLCFVKKLTGSGILTENRKRGLEKDFKGITQNNVTKFCLPVAILQGICWLEYEADKKNTEIEERWNIVKKISEEDKEYSQLEVKIEELLRAAGLVNNGILKDRNYSVEDVKKIQTSFADKYQIVVFAEADNRKPVFTGPSLMGQSILPLVCKGDHYQHISSLTKFVGQKYYCVDCKVAYNSLTSHYNCPLRCRLCNGFGCQAEPNVEITCQDCKVVFYSVECEKRHRDFLEAGSKVTVCGSTLYCPECESTYRKQKGHKCNMNYCQKCRTYRPKGHECTMSMKNKGGKTAVQQKFISVKVQYERVVDESGKEKQKPLLAMALRFCKECRDELETDLKKGMELTCKSCGQGNRLWFSSCLEKDVDVLQELTTFLVSKEHLRFTIVFHDMPDCVNEHFLNYITTEGSLKVKDVVVSEGRLRSLKFDGIKMKITDTKYLFPVSLWKLALANDALLPSFRYLPQSLIISENLPSVGLVPPIARFLEGIEDEEEANLVCKYHKKISKQPYDLVSELLTCTYYEALLLAATVRNIDNNSFDNLNIRLVEETKDLPSAALLAYQRSFLTDCILPLDMGGGSKFNNASSHSAREYLAWRSFKEGLPIDSSFNVGEYKIKGTPYSADGFIQPCAKYPRGLVIEIHGCYWHAHECSYVPQMVARRELDVPRIKDQDRRKEAITKEIHDYERVWECDIALLRKNEEVMEFMRNWVYEGPCEFLSAIYPPRSEVICHYAEADELFDLRICDITGLKGKILHEGEFPESNLRRLHGESFDVPIRTAEELRSQVRGVVYCEVLAPSTLFLPVLPDNINDRIIYHLCKACLERGSEICDHEEEERFYKGTWTTFELEMALEEGYVITRIIGAIHWDDWGKYKEEDGEEKHSIFSEYGAVLRKIEKMACGEEKDNKETNMVLQQATKSLMRLPDKFGRRSEHPTTQVINSPAALWKRLEDPSVLVREIKPASDHKLVILDGDRKVVIDAAGERIKSSKPIDTTVSMVPVLVGSQQRVEILRAVGHPDCDLLYIDEDLIIYRSPKGSSPLEAIGKDALPEAKLTKFWSNGTGHFVVETEEKDVFVKTEGFARKGDAFYARAEAIKRQTEMLVEGNPECVAIEHVSIGYDTYNMLKNCSATRLVHTLSACSRLVQSDGTTIPRGFLW